MIERACAGAAGLLLLVAGCAGAAPPAPPGKNTPAPAPAASSKAEEVEMTPALFTVEQIRAAIREDTRYTWRIEMEGEPTVTEYHTFYRVDAEGARVSSGGFTDKGTGFGVSPGHVTWEGLRKLGSFPKAK